MILLKLFAILLMIPGSLLLYLLSHLYFENKIYLIFMGIFALLYSTFVSFIINDFMGVMSFITILLVYAYRAKQMSQYENNLPELTTKLIVYGRAETYEMFSTKFWLDLSIIHLIASLPKFILKKISDAMGLNVDLAESLRELVQGTRGTNMEIRNNEHRLYLEII